MTIDPAPHPLGEQDLPPTFRAADRAARAAERRFLRIKRAELVLPLVAICFGAIGQQHQRWAAFVAAGAIGLLAMTRVVERSSHLEAAWYEARASAESMKALAWRYGVRALETDADGTEVPAADEAFLDALIAEAADDADPPLPEAGPEITDAMRALRASPLADRRARYLAGRLDDQCAWHERRARVAERAARRLDLANIFCEGVIVAFALAVVFGASTGLAIGVTASAGVAGALLTWAGVRRYSTLARHYKRVVLSLHRLTGRSDATATATEGEWCRFVAEVEHALAAEHTQWRRARGVDEV
jgi:hypothetical protein